MNFQIHLLVCGGAFQSPCSLMYLLLQPILPHAFVLFAAYLWLPSQVYLPFNAFDKCHLGGHPSPKNTPR